MYLMSGPRTQMSLKGAQAFFGASHAITIACFKGFRPFEDTCHIYIYFVTTYRFKIGSIWIPLTFELSTISDQKYHCNLHESASTYGCIWVPMYSRAALPALAAWEAVGPKHL